MVFSVFSHFLKIFIFTAELFFSQENPRSTMLLCFTKSWENSAELGGW